VFIGSFDWYTGDGQSEFGDEGIDDTCHAVGFTLVAQRIADNDLSDAVLFLYPCDELKEALHVKGADRLGEHAEGVALCDADPLRAEIDSDKSSVVW
jgi:hypothetical protein